MGWNGGSLIFSHVIESLKDRVDAETREEIYYDLIEVFENADADSLQECMGEDKAFDRVYKELNPSYFEEDENYSDDD